MKEIRKEETPRNSFGGILPQVSMEEAGERWRGEAIRDADLADRVSSILTGVREEGLHALARYAREFDALGEDGPLFLDERDLSEALARTDPGTIALLEQTAERIRLFAEAQRNSLHDAHTAIPGGSAGQSWKPVPRAGCYVPGGRYPLASSVLMTVIPAKVAGVGEIWVATPGDSPVILAAAAIAGARGVLRAGGAQAIAALAFGAGPIAACDVITGPGNRWVTEAKRQVAGSVRIDGLAGPSELLLVVDESANPSWAAADLIAQAEHDPDARVALIATSENTRVRVVRAVHDQLGFCTKDSLPIVTASLRAGSSLALEKESDRIALCDELAPEHLQISIRNADEMAPGLSRYGAMFLGERAPTALGDYGIGPNHVLPTGGAARQNGGLSVLNYLRCVTWTRIDENSPAEIYREAAQFARIEGLAGHASSLTLRADAGD